jgi:shikimate dehydrogenase
LKREDGSLLADMFDGEGFVRGVTRKGRKLDHASALVIGSGGVVRRSRRRWRRPA